MGAAAAAFGASVLAAWLVPPLPLAPGTWWEYRESYTQQVGALLATSDETTRFEVTGTAERPFLRQSGGFDPASAPVESGDGWLRLGAWTGEDPLPVPLVAGREGPLAEGALAAWRVEGDERVEVPAGAFRAHRCALRTPQVEAVLWIVPGLGVVRHTHGEPGQTPEIERVLLRWSGGPARGEPKVPEVKR